VDVGVIGHGFEGVFADVQNKVDGSSWCSALLGNNKVWWLEPGVARRGRRSELRRSRKNV
jgi:hypothetical protein